MIDANGIRRKAENLYRDFLIAWLNGDQNFFPRVIRCRKTAEGDLPAAIQAVRKLRDGSKEICGFGYTVEWREVNSRQFGRNLFPRRILFETQDDFLRLIGKQSEFRAFCSAVDTLRANFPELENWIRSNLRTMFEVAPSLPGLLEVLHLFRSRPRPACFARELPLSVDTKFIERNQAVLRQWFDIVLPPGAIRSDEDHFERRYGLQYSEPHLFVRLLDRQLMDELRVPFDEFSLPLHALGKLEARNVSALIVENKVNLLTAPPLARTIGLGGLGRGVTLLRYASWLSNASIAYWGDLDVEGFEILSALRALYPQTQSLLMDDDTLKTMSRLSTVGTGQKPRTPPHLTTTEQLAFERCRAENLRLEQERLPQSLTIAALRSRWTDGD